MEEVKSLSQREAQDRFHGIKWNTKGKKRRKAEREDESPSVKVNGAFMKFRGDVEKAK